MGPLLFNIYVSKLFEIIKNHLPDAHAYADDTQLYLSFKPDSAMSEFDAVHSLQSCIKDIKTWMTVDKLRLNENKTEFIVIGSRAQLSKVRIYLNSLLDKRASQRQRPLEILERGLMRISK